MKTARLFVCLVLMCLPQLAAAQDEVSALARDAERVVVGTVVDVAPAFETNQFGDQLIVSSVTLRVDETMKGSAEPAVVVKLEGGTVGDLTLDVSDMPTMKRGDRAAFFLERDKSGAYVPHDRGRGVMKLNASNRVEERGVTLDDVRREVRAAAR